MSDSAKPPHQRAAEVLRQYAAMIQDSELHRSGPLKGRCDPAIEAEVKEYCDLAAALESSAAPLTAGDVRKVMALDLAPLGAKSKLARALGLSKSWVSAVMTGHKEPCGRLLAHYGFERQVRYTKKVTAP